MRNGVIYLFAFCILENNFFSFHFVSFRFISFRFVSFWLMHADISFYYSLILFLILSNLYTTITITLFIHLLICFPSISFLFSISFSSRKQQQFYNQQMKWASRSRRSRCDAVVFYFFFLAVIVVIVIRVMKYLQQ